MGLFAWNEQVGSNLLLSILCALCVYGVTKAVYSKFVLRTVLIGKMPRVWLVSAVATLCWFVILRMQIPLDSAGQAQPSSVGSKDILYFNILYNLIGLLPMVLVCIGLRKIVPHFENMGFVDLPEARKNHTHKTARGAGVIIFIVVMLGFMLSSRKTSSEVYFVVAALLLFAVSIVDDFFGGASVRVRLTIQIVSSALFVLNLVDLLVGFGHIRFAIMCVALFLFVCWFVNLYNFMDGADGITGLSTVTFCALACLVCQKLKMAVGLQNVYILSYLCFWCCVGFLFFNWHKARVFIGDCGSITLGIFIAWIFTKLALFKSIYIFIALFYYISDTTTTLIHRLIRRQNLFEAHSEHFYQKAIRAGLTHSQVALRIFSTNAVLACLSWVAIFSEEVFGAQFVQAVQAFCVVAACIVCFLQMRAFAKYGQNIYNNA